MVVEDLSELPEEKRILLRGASRRITDISNNLIRKNKINPQNDYSHAKDSKKISLLAELLESIVSEKRSQYRSKMEIEIFLKLSSDSYDLFSDINPDELKCIISNLVNNSIEAMDNKGIVEIGISKQGDNVKIYVKDNGKGIPKAIIKKLGVQQVSLGKEDSDSGSGIGVFHAKRMTKSWGGQFIIESKEGVGTIISLILPQEKPPLWFPNFLNISENGKVVIIDDDISIHQIWKERINHLRKEIDLISFSNDRDLETWINKNETSNTLFLCDYELVGSQKNGLELIEALGIQDQAILVTSRSDEIEIRKRCERIGIKCLPKNLAIFIPIKTSHNHEKIDAVLIDDDELVRIGWEFSAKKNKKRLKTFSNHIEFLKIMGTLPASTPIFIDSCLGDGVKGEELADQIYSAGLTELYLCTGYEPEHFGKLPYIKKIIGKDPLWTT